MTSDNQTTDIDRVAAEFGVDVIEPTRCSSLDRVEACNGSILPSEGPREAGGPDAVLGQARHVCLADVALGNEPDLDRVAARFSVDADDLAIAVQFGRQAWIELAGFFPSPLVERQVASRVCRGTTDVLQVVFNPHAQELPGGDVSEPPTALRVLDWKTGWGTDLHPAQLTGYAHCAVQGFGLPASGVVSVFEVWTTHRQIRTVNLTETDLVGFAGRLDQIRDLAANNPDRLEYRAGSHCGFCPHRVDCRTREEWIREATTSLVAVDHGQAITVETIGRLYLKAQSVDRAMRKFWGVVDSFLDGGGVIPLPDGRRVERVETEREKIAAAAAIGVLMDRLDFGEDDRAALLGDVTKSALDRWAKGCAPKGKKAALMREVFGDLRDAGAIRTEPHRQKKILEG